MIYFTSDLHFGHKNIIKYCNRPFKDVEDMNSKLIANWNSVVDHKDTVYILGDFAFMPKDAAAAVFSSLYGHKAIVPGNHDSRDNLKAYSQYGIVLDMLHEMDVVVEDEKIHFVLCHYAMRVWNKSHHGAIHLYGHSHGSLPEDPHSLSCDVGVDSWDYKPVSMDDILVKMYKKKYLPVDHHGV